MPATQVQTQTDEHRAATVRVLPDGGKVQSFVGGQLADVVEDEPLPEPVVFTRPSMPNGAVGGTLFQVSPGVFRRFRDKYLWFRAGHAVARTKRELERLERACATGCYVEPAEAERAKKERLEFLDPETGRVLFWTYHLKAYQEFSRQWMKDRR